MGRAGYFSVLILPVMSRSAAEITMMKNRMYIRVPLITHFRKMTKNKKVRMTAMLSAMNARIDHFLNSRGSPSIYPFTGSEMERRD
jgi:hypothetical protein